MSKPNNRLGLRGLGLITWKNGTACPALTALWSEDEGQRQVSRGLASRGLFAAMGKPVPHLKEHPRDRSLLREISGD